MVIQIIHTGYSNNDIDVHGRLKGAGEIIFTDLRLFPKKLQTFEALIWVLLLFIILIILYLLINFIVNNTIRAGTPLIILMISMLISFGLMAKGEHYIKKRFSKLPKGLESFKEDYAPL